MYHECKCDFWRLKVLRIIADIVPLKTENQEVTKNLSDLRIISTLAILFGQYYHLHFLVDVVFNHDVDLTACNNVWLPIFRELS